MKTYVGKRFFDIFISLLLIIILLPLFLIISAVILIFSGRPIFFTQKRFGLYGNQFTILKFRTMIVGAEEKEEEIMQQFNIKCGLFNIQNDPRVTKIGKYLRRWNLDELPQFINVIKGDMSLVGPRPILILKDIEYILRLKPGITCEYQIYTKKYGNESINLYIDLAKKYYDRVTFLNDLRLIYLTILIVLFKQKY